jgi:hypothetical protein
MKAHALEDLPTRKDDNQRSDDMVEQAVMFQVSSPFVVFSRASLTN